ncbi:MAG: adenylate/guanylate cyclase domain-containing protein [Flavobacteriales bacterium]
MLQPSALAQDQHVVDSLQARLEYLNAERKELNRGAPGASDRLTADVLYEISKAYWYSAPSTAIDYAQQSLVLAEKIGYERGVALAYYSIGVSNVWKRDGKAALEFTDKALRIGEAIHDEQVLALGHLNRGLILDDQGNSPAAMKDYLAALKLSIKVGDKQCTGWAYMNMARIHLGLGDSDEALKDLFAALRAEQGRGDELEIGTVQSGIGSIYAGKGDYALAFEYYNEALRIATKMGDKASMAYVQQNLGLAYTYQHDAARAEAHFLSSLATYEDIPDKQGMANVLSYLGQVYRTTKRYPEASRCFDRALSISLSIGQLGTTEFIHRELAELDSARGDLKQAWAHYKIYVALHDSIAGEESARKVTQFRMQHDFDLQEAQSMAEQTKKDALAEKELLHQKFMRNGFMGGFVLVAVFAGVFLFQRKRISKEKQRSEDLLLNILPHEIAEELKTKGSAEAVHIDQVTVLFTDFKGFTAMSEVVTPQQLVRDLNECFSAFDHITAKYGIEKIKTIGDAYMAAGGLPTPNTTHATDVICAALEMRDFIAEGKAHKIAAGLPYFEIRIGIHTGPVVAGIVGVKKFQYDIWGDTVNTASRMESSGEIGQVNISEATYAIVRDTSNPLGTSMFDFVPRGKVQAKGKGEMEMYFVSFG